MRQSLRPLKECLAAAVGGLERRNWCSVMGSVDDDTLFGIACVKLSRCCELQYLQSYCRVRASFVLCCGFARRVSAQPSTRSFIDDRTYDAMTHRTFCLSFQKNPQTRVKHGVRWSVQTAVRLR